MTRSQLALEVPTKPGQPLFLAVAASIVREIERGRLKPGDRLPGARTLAQILKLHRNTIDAAFHELTMQGWLVAEGSRGTFVAPDLPDASSIRPRAMASARRQARAPTSAPLSSARLCVSDGAPDPRLMPRAELARAFRQAVGAVSFLASPTYGDPKGSLALREALTLHLAEARGLTASADDMLVTRGSQMGLFLAASAALRPGDAVAVEDPGYPLAWAAFWAAGAKVVGVPVDAGGLDLDRLEAVVDARPDVRAVYVTPHHQYPTTVTLGAGRRLRLLDLARRRGLTLVEDDYDHEYRFDGHPVLPLAAHASADTAVVHLGSLSKLLAPAVRLGYAVAPPALLRRMAERREAIDRQGDVLLENAVATLITDGDLRRHARKARRVYAARRDSLARELESRLAGLLDFELPRGGLALWVRVRGGDAKAWAERAAGVGLAIPSSDAFALDQSQPTEAFRFGFASLDDQSIAHAVTLLSATAPLIRATGG